FASLITCSRSMFFFFQAEDGIRDRNVTGVQTCALPIFFSSKAPSARLLSCLRSPYRRRSSMSRRSRRTEHSSLPILRAARPRRRSEERRVGKEGRTERRP